MGERARPRGISPGPRPRPPAPARDTPARRALRGIGAEINMQIIEQCFDWLDAPPARVHGLDVPLPYAANLEKLALPQPDWVVAAVKKLI